MHRLNDVEKKVIDTQAKTQANVKYSKIVQISHWDIEAFSRLKQYF